MILIQGESNGGIWHGHIQSVDFIYKTLLCLWHFIYKTLPLFTSMSMASRL